MPLGAALGLIVDLTVEMELLTAPAIRQRKTQAQEAKGFNGVSLF